MNADATGTGANRWALIARLKVSPMIAAGIKAIARLIANRCAPRSEKMPVVTPISLRRNSQQTARIAPAWITISNSFALSPV